MVRDRSSMLQHYSISNHHRSFYGQCPPLLLALALVVWRLPPSPSTRRSGQDDSKSPSRESSKLARIDFLGAILLAGAIITFLLILDLGSKRDSALKISVLAVLVVVLCGFLVWVEKRWAREPIFPLSLLANRDVVTSYLTAALQIAAQSGVWSDLSSECHSGPILYLTSSRSCSVSPYTFKSQKMPRSRLLARAWFRLLLATLLAVSS
jgi:hypothetical protein